MDLHRPSGNTARGLGLATTTMLLWGVLPLVLQAALRLVDPYTLTWFRFLVASAALAALLARAGALPALGRLGRGEWVLLAIATGGLAGNYIAYLLGLDRTTAANAQVLIQAAPLLLALGGIVVFRERFTRLQWIGFAVLVSGLAVFFRDQLLALGSDGGRYLRGVFLIGIAAVSWAGYGLAQKQLLRSLTSQGVMLCIYAGCTVIFWPTATPSALAGLSAAGLGILLFCAVNTLVAYTAFADALAHWEASRVSAVLALTPLATIASAEIAARLLPAHVQSEHLSAASLGGACLVVAGSLVTALGGRGVR